MTRTLTINVRKDDQSNRFKVDVLSNYKDPERKDKNEYYLMKKQ